MKKWKDQYLHLKIEYLWESVNYKFLPVFEISEYKNPQADL